MNNPVTDKLDDRDFEAYRKRVHPDLHPFSIEADNMSDVFDHQQATINKQAEEIVTADEVIDKLTGGSLKLADTINDLNMEVLEVGVENAELKRTSELTERLMTSQFILFMQSKSIWPCHQFIGDDPQPLTSDEVIKLKDDYKQALTNRDRKDEV